MAKPKIQPEVRNGLLEEEKETHTAPVVDPEAAPETTAALPEDYPDVPPVGDPVVTPLLDVEEKPVLVMMYRSVVNYPDGPNTATVHPLEVENYRVGGWMMLEEIPEDERPEV